jgi:hypothetical protein
MHYVTAWYPIKTFQDSISRFVFLYLPVLVLQFRNKEGIFSEEIVISTASKQPPHDWWQANGAGMPELRRAAVRILSLPSSSGACERNWSTFDFVHSRKRNRLHPKVFIRLILRTNVV